MSSPVNVRAIHALDDLRGALTRFAGDAREPLRAAEMEIRRTLDWLQERSHYWHRQVHLCQSQNGAGRLPTVRLSRRPGGLSHSGLPGLPTSFVPGPGPTAPGGSGTAQRPAVDATSAGSSQ